MRVFIVDIKQISIKIAQNHKLEEMIKDAL